MPIFDRHPLWKHAQHEKWNANVYKWFGNAVRCRFRLSICFTGYRTEPATGYIVCGKAKKIMTFHFRKVEKYEKWPANILFASSWTWICKVTENFSALCPKYSNIPAWYQNFFFWRWHNIMSVTQLGHGLLYEGNK